MSDGSEKSDKKHKNCELSDCDKYCFHEELAWRTDGLNNSDDVTEYEAIHNNSRPMRPRQVKAKDSTFKLRRAISGSRLDYRRSLPSDAPDEIYKNGCGGNNASLFTQKKHKSQPDRNHNLVSIDNHGVWQTRRQQPSPEPVPSLSLSPSSFKDSGVSVLNSKGSREAKLTERLLNNNTIHHQQHLTQVIRLLREEFTYEDYMGNCFKDLAMAEYIMSLANLRLDNFSNANTEKYSDLCWQDQLLDNLSEAFNGHKPVLTYSERSYTPGKLKSDDSGVNYHDKNKDSAFKPVNSYNRSEGGAPGVTVRPQWASGDDKMLQMLDQYQSETRHRWPNYIN
jgi:hypothetical protein